MSLIKEAYIAADPHPLVVEYAKSNNGQILRGLVTNPNLSSESLNHLIMEGSTEAHMQVLKKQLPLTSKQALKIFYVQKRFRNYYGHDVARTAKKVLLKLAIHPDLPISLYEEFYHFEEEAYFIAIAKNTYCPEDVLIGIANRKDLFNARKAVAENLNTPEKVLFKFLHQKTTNNSLNLAAAKNPSLGAGYRMRAITSGKIQAMLALLSTPLSLEEYTVMMTKLTTSQKIRNLHLLVTQPHLDTKTVVEMWKASSSLNYYNVEALVQLPQLPPRYVLLAEKNLNIREHVIEKAKNHPTWEERLKKHLEETMPEIDVTGFPREWVENLALASI